MKRGSRPIHHLNDPGWWFWARVKKGNPDQCWPWQGTCNPDGYGRIFAQGRAWSTHRLAYYLTHGEEAKNLVLHSCHNPPCCNPAHLRDGTQQDNMKDREADGNQKRGADHHMAKLTRQQVAAIRASTESTSALAAYYGLPFQTIWNARTGRTYRNQQ